MKFQFLPFALLIAALFNPAVLAQDEADDSAKIDPASLIDESRPIADRLTDVYSFAQKATVHEQLDLVLEACDMIVNETEDEQQKNYAAELAGWANFRQGDLWLNEAIHAASSAGSETDSGSAAEAGEESNASEEADSDEEKVDVAESALTKAMASFDAALEISPALHRAEHGRGIVHSMRGDFEDALASFDRVVSNDSTFPQAHFNRAECCLKVGQLEEAIKSYSAGIELRPQDPAPYSGRGHAYFAQGNPQQALLDYRRTVQLEPHNPNGLINRGDAQLALGNWSKALDDYRAARSEDPQGPVATQRIAMIKAACPDVFYRNEPAAYELALAAIELNDGKATAVTLDTLAAAQASNGWFEDAVQTMELAEQLSPEKFTKAMAERKKMYQAGNPYILK